MRRSHSIKPTQMHKGEPPHLVLDTLTNDVVGDGRKNLGLDVLQGETITGTGDGALGHGRGLC